MKKLVLSIIGAGILFGAEYNGYSYFAVGMENFSYSEKFVYEFKYDYKSYKAGESINIESNAQVNVPVYLSGSLIKFNNLIDLSMDFVSTLKPKILKESWNDKSTGEAVVENYATIMSNLMKMLLHLKISPNHRLTCGFSYIQNNFKRFDDLQKTLVEENSISAIVNIGYWFESNTAGQGFRVKYSLEGGIPIYQSVTNTAAPELEFTKKDGFNIDTSLYLGYSFFKGLEVGVIGNYSYMYRDGNEIKEYEGNEVLWPRNITKTATLALQVSWNFK